MPQFLRARWFLLVWLALIAALLVAGYAGCAGLDADWPRHT
jgi:hypothetical protein